MIKHDQVSGSHLDASVNSTGQKYKWGRLPYVGQKLRYDDGREFVFCSTAVDVLAGQLVSTATAQAATFDNLCTAAAIGSTTLTVNTTGVAFFGGSAGVIAANRLAGGYIVMNDDAGEGYTYRIKSHTAGTASASVTFTLYDPLVVAATVASDIFIVGPRYDQVVLATTALPPVGVACVDALAATSTYVEYFWAQTKGIAGVYVTTGTSVAIGKVAVADTGGVKLGTLTGNAEDMQIPIGVFMGTETTATGKCPVLLNIGG